MSHHNVNSNRHRGPRQAHMNKLKFDPNRHKDDHDKIDKSFYDVMTSLCCRRCCDQLQWKVDYGKFIPLERPRKCNICSQKTVAIAYHHICQECAKDNARCAKCQKTPLASKLAAAAGGQEESSDDGEIPLEERKDYDPEHVLNKYAFVDEPVEDEEFAHLQGLDIRRLVNHKRRVAILREKESRANMRERERRSHIRAQKKANEGVDTLASEDDSDEEI